MTRQIWQNERRALDGLEELRLRKECINICIRNLRGETTESSVIKKAYEMRDELELKKRELDIDLRRAILADKHIYVYQDGSDHACIEYHDNSGRRDVFIYDRVNEDYFKYMNEALDFAEK